MVFSKLKDDPVTPVQIELGYLDDVPKRFAEFLSTLLDELIKESEKEDDESAEEQTNEQNSREKFVS